VDNHADFCQKPWDRPKHGHFFSDWRTIPELYPVFSPGKAPGFSDIRIPSHYYYYSTPRYTYGYDAVNFVTSDFDENEQPWTVKRNKIFWRGATTGGGAHPRGYIASYQRHRLVNMTSGPHNQEAAKTIVVPSPYHPGAFSVSAVRGSDVNEEIADVAFTAAVGCENYKDKGFDVSGCEAMEKDFRFASAVPLGEHWMYKYLIDVDGYGYSGRFLAFMLSESAVIKSTIYKEFFSDWVQPWLHYIPLSMDYSELYNVYAYFAGPTPSMMKGIQRQAEGTIIGGEYYSPPGDAQLRNIALAGRKWKRTTARLIDMDIYVYRLCLEYARLWADDRESMSYQS